MALSTAAKAALCICPPALMAGTVATVPPVKRAVHHVTAPRQAPKALRHTVAKRPAEPQAVTRQEVACDPMGGGTLPAVPLVTYATPLPDEPGIGTTGTPGATSSISTPGFGPTIGGIAVGGGGGGGGGITPVTPGTPGTPTPTPSDPGAGAVPEPSVWLMMILGAGTLGGALRRRRRAASAEGPGGRTARRAAAGGLLWSGSAAVEAGDMAATVALKSTVASVAGKAMLCVCPAAIVAGSVMTVPPVRQAVYAATVPTTPLAAPPPAAVPLANAQPCPEPMTVPVAATAVQDFPAAVETVPAETARAAAPAKTEAVQAAAADATNKTV
ncbi:MAG: PEP-CTERM sorting domain-containing protein [Sphingomonas taxi]